MHKGIVVLMGLLTAAPLLNAAESTSSRFYLTPSVEYYIMSNGPKLNSDKSYPYGEHDFKNTPAIGLSTGFSLTKSHAIEFETMYFKTETRDSSYYSPSYRYTDPKGKLQAIPLLVGYKYTNDIKNQLSWYIGTSIGITLLETEITSTFLGYDTPGYSYSPPSVHTWSHRSSAFTFASDLGMEYKLNDCSKITFGLKSMYFGEGHETTPGVATSVNLGCKFSF